MQNAKDTFYVTLRDRLAAVNADRTVAVRGQVRPAVVVDENEEPARGVDAGAFHLQWSDVSIDTRPGLLMESALCRVAYRSRSDAGGSELGRGRVLDAMHEELTAMLQPESAPLQLFNESGSEMLRGRVWWLEDGARVVTDKDGMVQAVALVRVMSRREDGE